ncbi:hypothetical protein B9Z55_010526 [Caenorhabditis nigoni]|nr:hypothetical protein B9Z55_010526 [Caenorhabditis nigoni]
MLFLKLIIPIAIFYPSIYCSNSTTTHVCVARQEFQCKIDGSCISMKKWQDGVDDCYDGSDEVCLPWQFDCQFGSPRCISKNKLNDKKIDCYSGFDEGCPAHYFVCRDRSACIEPTKYLNGVADCIDKSDEPCAQNQFQCADGTKCIPKSQFQNGREDCDDGSDEECTTSQFACQCGRVRCVAESFIMDGNWDCEDGSDEFINKTIAANCTRNNKVNIATSYLSLGKLKFCSGKNPCKPELGQVCVPGNSGSDGFLESGTERIPFMFQEEEKNYVSVIPDEIIDSYGTIMTPPELKFNRDDIQCGNKTCGLHERCQRKKEGKYECECAEGFTMFGGTCQELFDECRQAKHDCHPEARCVDALIGYECLCREGFLDTSIEPKTRPGRKCRKLVNECTDASQNDCHQNARCLDKPIGYTCRCQDDYVDVSSQGARKPGRNCTKAINECALNLHNCDPHAICQDQPIGYSCRCPFGFMDASTSAMEPGRKCVTGTEKQAKAIALSFFHQLDKHRSRYEREKKDSKVKIMKIC